MNKIFVIQILLGATVLVISLMVFLQYQDRATTPTTSPVLEESMPQITEVVDEEGGFAFSYPTSMDGYSLAKNSLGNGVYSDIITAYTLTSFTDVVAMTSGPERGEGPPTIRLRVYKNSDELSVLEWTRVNAIETNIDFAFEEPVSTKVAGLPAIRFRADGLYAYFVYVLEYDGKMYIFEAGFIGETDKIVTDFENILSSVRFFTLGTPVVVSPQDESELPAKNIFKGVLEEVNVGCFVDGECYVVVDGVKVTVIRGWRNETVGRVIGVDGFGDLEAFIGEEVEVSAQDMNDGTFSLYGDARYYVKLLDSGSVLLRLNETASVLGVSITPLSVLEDSRCPSDVVCVWAGIVKLAARLESGLGIAPQEFMLNGPVTTETETITLVRVDPVPFSQTPIPESEYRFLFKVTKR